MEGALTRTNDDGVVYKENWREHLTYMMSDFFELLKKQFSGLELVGNMSFFEVPMLTTAIDSSSQGRGRVPPVSAWRGYSGG